jgi:CoA:oxalate CoA-transferase
MRPLEGIRVLDFSHAVAGPHCTHQLRLLGADIVKIERPGVGDDLRHYTEHAGAPNMSAPFVAFNSGKRSLTLDLKSPDAPNIIARLVSQADVVVENFRPDVAKKLGVDYDSLTAIKSDIIYCSISGFGSSGPLRDWPAYDHIVQAMSGLMSLNGEPDQGPLKVGIPLADCFSGYMAAYAILAAVIQRLKTGEGQQIDVSMLDSLMVLMNPSVVTYGMSLQPPRRTGNDGFRLVATAGVYQTSDGHIAIGANHPPQIKALFEALDVLSLLDDPRFADHKSRVANGPALRAILQDVFITKTAAELESKLASVNVPAAMVRDLPQALAHPHVIERDVVRPTVVPGLDRPIGVVGEGFMFKGKKSIPAGSVPTIGEHTDQILNEIGLSASAIENLRARGSV